MLDWTLFPILDHQHSKRVTRHFTGIRIKAKLLDLNQMAIAESGIGGCHAEKHQQDHQQCRPREGFFQTPHSFILA
jgi:hypothetical protein